MKVAVREAAQAARGANRAAETVAAKGVGMGMGATAAEMAVVGRAVVVRAVAATDQTARKRPSHSAQE